MSEKKTFLILVVEDDHFLLKAYNTKLKKSGYQVETAMDGNEALEKMKAVKPDLVLLDLVMPKKNGFEVLQEVQKDTKLKKIPVIILSNLGQESDRKKGLELGAVSYLVKSDHSLQQIVDLIATKLA